MTSLFISGVGTELGKTYLTELVVRRLLQSGRPVRALKPVVSGAPDLADPSFAHSDTARLLRAQGLPLDPAQVEACSPWRYRAALSPDMAAAAEGEGLRLAELARWTREAVAGAPAPALTLIEGAGGLMSPICEDATNLDFLLALDCPTLLVCGSYLGSISHCLTALEALRARGGSLLALVINESENAPVDLGATANSIARFTTGLTLATLARGAREPPQIVMSLLAAR